ncbi:MAG TPA: glycosyltransferase family 4 protein [Clostridiales bacterium]|nr:glycosyltransferase family 4 protein [Clostridiales bacterium]
MKKALIVASVFGFLGSFERGDIRILQEQGYQVFCAANGKKELGAFGDTGQLDDLPIIKCQVDFVRSPFSKSNIRAFRQLKQLMKDQPFDLVHCHTPIGGFLARLVAKRYRKNGTKVIYTVHGFHFYKEAPFMHWLLYYPAEWLMARYTDVLITINREDYTRAQKFQAKQVEYVPGVGIDLHRFSAEGEKSDIRIKLGIPQNAVLLLSVGELIPRKNHQAIICALASLKDENFHYVVIGEGPERENLASLIARLSLEARVHLPGYRKDMPPIYRAADLFCLPSRREGLCVALMEAMASGLPCVASDIRGNRDLIISGKGGYLFDLSQIDSAASAIDAIVLDLPLKKAMRAFNQEFVRGFSVEVVAEQMRRIYREI